MLFTFADISHGGRARYQGIERPVSNSVCSATASQGSVTYLRERDAVVHDGRLFAEGILQRLCKEGPGGITRPKVSTQAYVDVLATSVESLSANTPCQAIADPGSTHRVISVLPGARICPSPSITRHMAQEIVATARHNRHDRPVSPDRLDLDSATSCHW